MKKILTITAILFAGAFCAKAQTTIVQWTFDGATAADVPGGAVSPTPATGTGTLQLTGGTTSTIGNGSGSSDLVSPAGSNFSWQTTNYPVTATGDKTAGIIISVSTAGFNSLSLTFDQRLSTTANNTWIVYYTADITAGTPDWTLAKTFTFTPAASGTGDVWYIQRTVDLSSFTSLNNNANAAFKIVSSFDPVAGNYLAAQSTKTYAVTGNTRFDMLTLTGIADVIVENAAPVASNTSFTGNLNADDTLKATYTYSDAEADAEGTSVYTWYSADDATGTNAVIIEGADLKYYVLNVNDENKFIAFKVTPAALTGTSPGEGVITAYQGPVLQSREILLYPAPFDLSSKNYKLDSWPSASAAGMYPPNMYFQQFNTEPGASSLAPSDLWKCNYNNTSKSRMVGLDGVGVAFLNTSDAATTDICGNGQTGGYVGAAVLALKTTGLSHIVIHYTVSLVAQASVPEREYRLRPQYKKPGDAAWSDDWASNEFTSKGATAGINKYYTITSSPADIENSALVYVRWIYYQVASGASGIRPEISIDDIIVESSAFPNTAPLAENVNFKGLPQQGIPFAGFYDYSDAEGDIESGTVLQWFRADDISGTNAKAIDGAVSDSYTPTLADVGKYFMFAVTPASATGLSPGLQANSVYRGPVAGIPVVLGLAESKTAVDVYPNPTPGDLSVTGSDDNPVVSIAVLNITGQEVLRVAAQSKTTIVPFTDMRAGFYLLAVIHRDGTKEVRKVVRAD